MAPEGRPRAGRQDNRIRLLDKQIEHVSSILVGRWTDFAIRWAPRFLDSMISRFELPLIAARKRKRISGRKRIAPPLKLDRSNS